MMGIKIVFLLVFFGIMLTVGFLCRRTAADTHGFVLGGRNCRPVAYGAFAYGTSYFSAVVFVGYAGQFGWKYGIAATWVGHRQRRCWALCWPGWCWAAGPAS